MKRWVVVDTNVLINGVVTARAGSAPQRIVDAMLSGALRFLVSEELVFEYRRVLLYPHLVARHGLPEAEVDTLLKALLLNAGIREADATAARQPVLGGAIESIPGDEHVVALLRAAPGAILITGDRRLAESVGWWCDVLTPAEFAATLD